MAANMASSCTLFSSPLGFPPAALTIADSNPISLKSLKTLTHTTRLKAFLV
uniref:Uncharacterized protein n=1 Tax=Arundo donax TaxID=35708 RepID=A0A0A8YWM5_ARUDO